MSQSVVDANSAASEEDVAAVVDSGGAIAADWRDFVVAELEKNANLPCYREVVLLDRAEALLGLRTTAEQLIAGAADDLQSAIARSLQNLDQDDAPGVWLHQGFHTWLLERNALGIDPRDIGALFGGPIGAAAAADNVRERLPLRSEFTRGAPRGKPKSGGHKLAPGVYLYAPTYSPNDGLAHLTYGRLQGSRIRSEYWAWRRYIMETVSGLARPIARFELRKLALGPSVGDVPAYVWAPGDPIPPDSALGTIMEQERQVARLLTIADAECKAFRIRERELQDLAIERDDLAREREQEQALGWQRIAAIGLGAFAVAAIARGRR